MRTKRKNYKYDSSDYDNADYDQDDFEENDDENYGEEDQVDESGNDSEYGDSNEGKKTQGTKSKGSRAKNGKEEEEDNDDTYEDEDPFSPEIDQILADRQIDLPYPQVATQSLLPSGRPHRSSTIVQQPKVQNWFLVKFVDQSYLHVRWMEESKLEEYSYRSKQKIRRYFNAKEKKRLLEQQQRQTITLKPQKTHHFSDDEEEEEEEEDGAIKGIPLPILPMPSDDLIENEEAKVQRIKVENTDGEDLAAHFDKNFVIVERVLSTTQLFPVIHPRQAKLIRGKWQDDCLNVVSILVNFRKNNVPIGLAFTEQLDQENEDLVEYFKIVKEPIDFVMIMNRLYNKDGRIYSQPMDFWKDLGLVFKNCRAYYKSMKTGLRKQCDALRTLAFHLYNDWYQEQKNRFITGIALPPEPQQNQSQRFLPQQASLQLGSLQSEQSKDTTIVNLQTLLRSQQMPNDQNKQSPLQPQPASQQPQTPLNPIEFQQQQMLQAQNMGQSSIMPQAESGFQAPSLPSLSQVMQGQIPGMMNLMMLKLTGNQNAQLQNIMQVPNLSQGFNNDLQRMPDPISQNLMLQMQGQSNFMDFGNSLQLPSMRQLQQQLAMNQFQNPYSFNSFPLMNDPQQLIQMQYQQQQQDKQIAMMNQLMGQGINPAMLTPEQLAYLSMGGDLSQFNRQLEGAFANLPSLQLPSLATTIGNLGLPSLNSLGLNSLDPYSMSMMDMNPNSFMNQQLQQQNSFKLPQFQSTMNTQSAYDEMSMMLGGFQQPQFPSLAPSFNPFNQNMNQQMVGNSFNSPFQNQNQPKFTQQPQIQSQIDPNLIQPDNLDQYNDKALDHPVPPCIIDPGAYDLSWLIEQGERLEDLQNSPFLTQQEIENAIKSKSYVDQLYLIKWKGLSFSQVTWEPESLFKTIFDEKIQDFNRFNRSLDTLQRDKLDQTIKNHKKMLRFTEKKYQNKRIDPQQEANLALQEARINRQLLNVKIQDLMGAGYYQVIQYGVKTGIIPSFKKPSQQLKDYQLVGLNWLIRAWHEHRNVVLADEMGLGKTIMTLALFDHLFKVHKLRGPFLILAPLTTLEHWKRIADEWTTLNSILYYDQNGADGRNEIRYWEWYYNDVTFKGQLTQKQELFKFNLIITSFEVFMQDLNPILQEVPFLYIVVDEAHRLKNKQAKTLKLLKDHPCKRILLLTGTPVQNNTKELWTLLNYIEPEKFHSMDDFMEQYGNLESFEQIQKLHNILKPHFLRRLKEEVDNSIPPLQETVIEVGLTTLQNTYYKGIYGENRMMLAKFGTNSIKTSQLNNIDVQLRKCCNHLFLLKGVEEELTKDCISEEDVYKKLLESSGKLMLLDKFIEKFKEENHKMLIFSQFKRMLDIIEFYLKMKAVPYEKLTGSVKTQDRINAIQRFNDDKTFGVFLLTTRAGGLGINLTSARVVIIFDSDWNPQNDLQAIARAHRIGQKFEVQVYRLITSKTYEEQMFERASKKLGMEQALFSKGAFHTDDAELSSLHLKGIADFKQQDSKEIENLLKYGAYAFIDNDGEDNDQVNFNKDIDEILATGKKKEFTYNKGLYTLSKSTFNARKYENLPDFDDPEFWNKVMPFESIMSISMLEKKFKKDKKELAKNDKLQKEFFKDLEIVFNDFMDAKFDTKTSVASKKQLENDEEKLREILKKMIKLTGMKLIYIEKCKEMLRDMLRTNKRKKPANVIKDLEGDMEGDVEDEEDQVQYDDDIILYDSGDDQIRNRNLRKRNPLPQSSQQPESQPGPKKRGRKPKNQQVQQQQQVQQAKQSFDESAEQSYDQEEEYDYGDEEDKEYLVQEAKLGKRQHSDNSEDDGRYLRGGRKRQKADDNFNSSQQLHNLQSGSFKVNEQLIKRNEKNGIVCAHCIQPHSAAKPCVYFCTDYCQRFFHEECKDLLFSSSDHSKRNSLSSTDWKCDDCLEGKAVCFCCKEKGDILLFPKKGKPMAASELVKQGITLEEVEEKELPKQLENEDSHSEEDAVGEEPEQHDSQPDHTQQQLQQASTKIVLSLGKTSEQDGKSPLKNQVLPDQEIPDKHYVVRCTLGGCYKYYHVDCVYTYNNVSCINSKKRSRFRCPMHYCEICQASGDSVLIVQCVLCPTSYHLKCLPQDTKAIRLTKKYIVCGTHNLNPEDFPKYEEKTPQQTYGRNGGHQSSLIIQNQSSLNIASKSRRGRKPKSAVEQPGASDGEYEQQLSAPNVPTRTKNTNVVIKLGSDSQQKGSFLQDVHSSGSSALNEPNTTPKPLFQVIRGQKN